MMRGDESYAGAKSWYRFKGRIKELTGFTPKWSLEQTIDDLFVNHLTGESPPCATY